MMRRQATGGVMTGRLLISLIARCERAFLGQVRRDHDRHVVVLAPTRAGGWRRSTTSYLPEDRRDLRHHARLVLGQHAQVIARLQLLERQHVGGRRWRRGRCCSCLNASGGGAQGGLDHVGDDGRRGRHLPRAAAVEEAVAQRVAVDADRVEAAADFGQHVVLVHQRRVHAKRRARSPRAVRSAIASSLMT